MKAKIKEQLKQKYSNLGFGENILDSLATLLEAKVSDESEVENKINELEGLLKVFQSNEDKNRTEAKKHITEIDGLKKKLAELEKIGSENQNLETEKKENLEEIPAWAKNLTAEIATLKGQLEQEKGKQRLNERQNQLSQITSKLPDVLKKSYLRIDLKSLSDEEFDNLQNEIKEEVTSISTTLKSRGAIFNPPQGANEIQGNTISDNDAKEVASMIKI